VAVIKEAYRDAVKVWHPDRFENDPRLRAKSEEKFKLIQVAYRELIEHSLDVHEAATRTTDSRHDNSNREADRAGTSLTTCGGCGKPISTDDAFCAYCGSQRTPPPSHEPVTFRATSPSPIPPNGQLLDFSTMPWLPPYYRDEFQKIFASGEGYQGKWNWAAFMFGGIWAFTKGLWAPVVLCLVISIPLGGLPALLLWAYFAARGNFLYYKKVIKGQNAIF
jgi:hypothetical protein